MHSSPHILAQQEFRQIYPQEGWVEHDPEEIWQSVLAVYKQAQQQATESGLAVGGIGITNQRETTLVWDRKTGKPIYNAIVWQDRRTADYCANLKSSGRESEVAELTGLLLYPYFSATKVHWILDNVAEAREMAERGELAFGTVDSFLLWRLTGGELHATDATNASRTMLFNIHLKTGMCLCSTCSRSRSRCCPRLRIVAPISGRQKPACSGAPSRLAGWWPTTGFFSFWRICWTFRWNDHRSPRRQR